MDALDRNEVSTLLAKVSAGLAAYGTGAPLLETLTWPREVEEAFFTDGENSLPDPTYDVDQAALDTSISGLTNLLDAIDGETVVHEFLRSHVRSARDKARLVAAVGSQSFGQVSREIYGGSDTLFLGRSKLDLATHLLSRIEPSGWDRARKVAVAPISAEELRSRFETKLATKRNLDVRVLLDDDLSSKAIASSSRVRIRSNTSFFVWEAEGLYRHEVETHTYSANNGALQTRLPFLKSGGPRSTETQEGLAVFAELFHRALATPRLRRLALRVKTVAMGESGASFLDVYRFLTRDEGLLPRDAYLDAARVFRGGDVRGGSVFTKDTVYLSGLLRVYAFLSVFVRAGLRDECELLLAGRSDLDDIGALVELDRLHLLERPRYLPKWLREWDTLLPYFAFTSFFGGIDLSEIEARFRSILPATH